jgi:hypothetical protein
MPRRLRKEGNPAVATAATATKKATEKATEATADANGHLWWTPKGKAGQENLAKLEITSTVLREADKETYRNLGVSSADYLALEVPSKEGYLYDLSKVGDRYVAALPRLDFVKTTAPGPVGPQLPAEFAKLEGEELRAAFAEYFDSTERAHSGLRRHAIRTGYCSTFDRIMEHHGLTGRKRRARVTFKLSHPTVYTAEHVIRNWVGGDIEGATGEISVMTHVEIKMDGDFDRFPEKGKPILAYFPEEKVRAAIKKVLEGNRRASTRIDAEEIDLSKIVVAKVTGDQGQDIW